MLLTLKFTWGRIAFSSLRLILKKRKYSKKQNKTIKHLCCIWAATNVFLNQHKNVTNETFLVGHLL